MSNEELKKKLMLEEMMTVSEEELQKSANGMYNIYTTFKKAGFTPKQIFELVKSMIIETLAQNKSSRM